MIVMKFGGTSVANGTQIATLGSLVKRAQGRKPLLVVSALGGVTDRLIEMAQLAKQGQQEKAQELKIFLEQRHQETLIQAGVKDVTPTKTIQTSFAQIGEWIQGITLLRELTPRTMDAVVSTGEILSSQLVAEILRQQGIPAVWVDPRHLMKTDTNFGNASPLVAEIQKACSERLLPLFAQGSVPVTGGFVGQEFYGETTTLGRGGSDYSAALFGAAIQADAIEIWTDVNGILTADPRLIPGAKLVPSLSYAEAAELAFFGAKVLHPATIRPAIEQNIPVWIKNTFSPDAPGSEVKEDAKGEGVRALAARKNCVALFLSNPKMLFAHGYAAQVFRVFETLKVPVDVITTSEVSISVTVDENAPLDMLTKALASLVDVEIVPRLAVVAVIGKNLRNTPGIASQIFYALQGVNILMISQGASQTNLTFVIEEKDLLRTMNDLHKAFFASPSREINSGDQKKGTQDGRD